MRVRHLLLAVPSFLASFQRSSALMTSAANSITLNDGRKHPLVGYGTYKVGFVPASASSAVSAAAAGDAAKAPEVTAAECVEMALDVGYRFLDCAEFYGNEAEVGKARCRSSRLSLALTLTLARTSTSTPYPYPTLGPIQAIAKSGVPRDELFLASKCWTTTIHKGPEAVQAQLEKTLKDLGVDYLDLYCIHWPVPGKHVAAYQQLEKAQAAGLVRSLGVSNYAVEDLEELMASARVVPTINQIEINPFLHRSKTIAFCESKGVKLQSYRSLRDGKAFNDPTVVAVAAKHGRTAAQVLGRWCVQHGYIYIPKSVKRERMEENMRVFDFELDADDMAQLDALTTPEALDNFVAVRPHCATQQPPRPAPPRRAAPRRAPPRPAPHHPRPTHSTERVRAPRRAQLYKKCVVRDTPDAGRTELVRTQLTVD